MYNEVTASNVSNVLNSRVVRCAYGGFFNGSTFYQDPQNGGVLGIRMHCSRGALLVEGMGRINDTYVFGRSHSDQHSQIIQVNVQCKYRLISEAPIINKAEGLFFVYNTLNHYNESSSSKISFRYQDAMNGLVSVRLSADNSSITSINFVCFPYTPYREDLSTDVSDLYPLQHGPQVSAELNWGCDMSIGYFNENNEGEVLYRVLSALDIAFEENTKLWGIGQRACRDILPRDVGCVEGCGPSQRIDANNMTSVGWPGQKEDPYDIDHKSEIGCQRVENRGWYDALCQGYPHDYCRYVYYWRYPNSTISYWESCASSSTHSRCTQRYKSHSDPHVFYSHQLIDYQNNCKQDDFVSHEWKFLRNVQNSSQCLFVTHKEYEIMKQESQLSQQQGFENELLWKDCPKDEIEEFGFWFRGTRRKPSWECGVAPGMCVTQNFTLQSCQDVQNFTDKQYDNIQILGSNWTADARVFSDFLKPFQKQNLLQDSSEKLVFLPGWSLQSIEQVIDYDGDPVDLMLRPAPWRSWGEVWSNAWGRVLQLRPSFQGQIKLQFNLSTEFLRFERLRGFNVENAGMVGQIPELQGVQPSPSLRSLILSRNQFVGSLPYDWPLSNGFQNIQLTMFDNNNLTGPVPELWIQKPTFSNNETKIAVYDTNLCERKEAQLSDNFVTKSMPQQCTNNTRNCMTNNSAIQCIKLIGDDRVRIQVEVEGQKVGLQCSGLGQFKEVVNDVLQDTCAHKIQLYKNQNAVQCDADTGVIKVTVLGDGVSNSSDEIETLFDNRIQLMKDQNQLQNFRYISGSNARQLDPYTSSNNNTINSQTSNNKSGGNTPVAAVAIPIIIIIVLVGLLFVFVSYRKGFWPFQKNKKSRNLQTSQSSIISQWINVSIQANEEENKCSQNQQLQLSQRHSLRQLGSGSSTMHSSSAVGVSLQQKSSKEFTNCPIKEIMPSLAASGAAPLVKDFQIDVNVHPERDLTLSSKLGSGGFGVVYKAFWKTRQGENKLVAVKTLDYSTNLCSQLNEKQFEKIRNIFYEEINVMLKVKHPCIVQFYGACLKPQSLALVMEYMDGGNLAQLLYDSKYGRKLKYREIISILESISAVLAYLHPTILHKDIKPQNVLLDSQGNVKLADFGLSQIKAMDQTLHYQHAVGTPAYLPPEAWTSSTCTAKCDIYQLGLLAWEIFAAEQPWSECQMVGQIVQKLVLQKSRPIIPLDCPPFLSAFIEDCWKQNPEERPSATELWSRVKAERKSFKL